MSRLVLLLTGLKRIHQRVCFIRIRVRAHDYGELCTHTAQLRTDKSALVIPAYDLLLAWELERSITGLLAAQSP